MAKNSGEIDYRSQFHQDLTNSFAHPDPKSSKMTVKSSVLFALLGSAHVKAALKTLVKLTTGEALNEMTGSTTWSITRSSRTSNPCKGSLKILFRHNRPQGGQGYEEKKLSSVPLQVIILHFYFFTFHHLHIKSYILFET